MMEKQPKWGTVIKNIIGYGLMAFAYLAALIAFLAFGEEGVGELILFYIIFALLPFLTGLFLVRPVTIHNFYESGWFRTFMALTLIIPFALFAITQLANIKASVLMNKADYLYLGLYSKEIIGYIVTLSHMITLLLALYFVILWRGFKRRLTRVLGISFAISLVLSVLFIFDFRAVDEDGLINSPFGIKQTYAWEEVDSVALLAKTDSPPFGSRTGTQRFSWRFVFHLNNGKGVIFDGFGYPGGVTDSLAIKTKVQEERIPLEIDHLTDEDRTYVNQPMDDHPQFQDDFLQLFEIERWEEP